ncbi:alpha/beta fold hydrolase [Streptomyces sp. NBC_01190]|uniref:alpha/beta fold hydrolase n=1 Tax=Streptomyces sp. NBC_01190 TaxID=2903767 RepID=UPI003866E393|nr:alpha/beta hydrolase [Streptomyces sp. NBC_01190]
MIQRHEVRGAGDVRLAAWEFAGADTVGVPGPPGGRPGVLMLHGLLGRASHWAPTARRLAPHYRVLALDQRGHGRSGKPGGPYTPDAYVADAIAAVEQLGLAPVTLVGHSMGALTAWQCAARRPDLVAAVVICDMRASPVGEVRQRELADWLASWPVPFATLGDVRRWFAAGCGRTDSPDPVRGDYFAEVMEERQDGWRPLYATEHLLRSRDPWIRDAHWDELAHVTCPALVVRGLDGLLGRAEAQEMVRVLPRGRYAEIPDAGPLVPWEQPGAWYATLESFLPEAMGPADALQGSVGAA